MTYSLPDIERIEFIKPGTTLKKWLAKQTVKPFAIINASLYTANKTPIGTIIENGKLVRNQGTGYGFGIMPDGTSGFGTPWKGWQDYITGYTGIVQDGRAIAPTFSDSYVFNKKLNRIALGQKNGVLQIITANSMTIKQFGVYCVIQGMDDVINLDGGGSRFLYHNGKQIHTSSRIPYNGIAFYKSASLCPYTEPTTLIRYGSRGEGVKWVQWHLVKAGYSLTVDGIFGKNTKSTVTDFQKANHLMVDGLVGAQTRQALRGL